MISLCLTTYNRTDLLFQSFEQVINDDRISEIVISDDRSDDNIYQAILDKYKGVEKVKIFRNHQNLDCYRNKRQAVKLATNDWVIIFDSDNIITPKYIDAICSKSWEPSIILQPSFAKPHFNFRNFIGTVTKNNLRHLMNDATFQTMLNAMNYFVNRNEYLRVWDYSQPLLNQLDPVTSDSLFQNYAWLASGNSFSVVADMEYEHRVHDGSHYQQNVRRTPQGFHDSIIQKLKQL